MDGLSTNLDGKNKMVIFIVKLKIVGSSIGNRPAEILNVRKTIKGLLQARMNINEGFS
jgi:hypothetical protein